MEMVTGEGQDDKWNPKFVADLCYFLPLVSECVQSGTLTLNDNACNHLSIGLEDRDFSLH